MPVRAERFAERRFGRAAGRHRLADDADRVGWALQRGADPGLLENLAVGPAGLPAEPEFARAVEEDGVVAGDSTGEVRPDALWDSRRRRRSGQVGIGDRAAEELLLRPHLRLLHVASGAEPEEPAPFGA